MSLTKIFPLIYAAAPAAIWIANASLARRRIHSATLFCITCFGLYIFLLVSVQVIDVLLERELYRFDLDGDGSFSDDEMTADAKLAMDAFTSDTGRNLAPVTGVPITLVWVTLCFVACFVLERAGRFAYSFAPRSADMLESAPKPALTTTTSDNGNPYRPPTTQGGG